jgi:uncharacterized membrane protein YdfJ with MMPL/SSD domain
MIARHRLERWRADTSSCPCRRPSPSRKAGVRAVGSDHNLLLVSPFKEEIHAGINTGIIRSMAGSGSVVTAAGLVFAFTMASFAFSDLIVLAQIGTTIALGL